MDEGAEIATVKARSTELADAIKVLVEERKTSFKVALALAHELKEERRRVLELEKQLGHS